MESSSHQEYIGYSQRINDPAFQQYRKNYNRWAIIFGIGLSVVVIVGFYIYGNTSNEMSVSEALTISFIISAMYMTITFLSIVFKGKGKSWDGVVIDKKIEKKSRVKDDGDHRYSQQYLEYSVIIRQENGKKKIIKHENTDVVYHYYQIGDKVRFHGKLNSFEKFDKSKDTIIFCNACATINEIERDVCFRCKTPLLK